MRGTGVRAAGAARGAGGGPGGARAVTGGGVAIGSGGGAAERGLPAGAVAGAEVPVGPGPGPGPGSDLGSGSGAEAVAALVRTLAAVLGAGALLLPAALAPVPAGYSVLVAVVVVAWCVLIGAAGGSERGSVSVVRRRLGAGPARAVTALYFAGFATGQAAVALTAGEFAARLRGDAFLWAVVVLLTAAAVATYRPRPLSTPVRRLRLAAVLVAAGGWWALGGTPDASAAPWTLLPLLFGWVGVESAVPDVRRHRPAFAGTLLGVLAAAALYAVLLRPPAPLTDLPQEPLALLSALTLWLYCRTNLQATGARWHELTGRPVPEGTATATTLALVTLTLAHLAGGTTAVLLLLPGIATAAILAAVACAAVRNR
jgi:amino acid efflux transporter